MDLCSAQGRGLVLFLHLVLLSFAMMSEASPPEKDSHTPREVIIVVAPDRPLRSEFITSLNVALPKNYRTRTLTPMEFSGADLEQADFFVVLGSSSLETVRNRKVKQPVIASYISALTYKVNRSINTAESTIFPAADWGVQMQLARLLLPHARTTGVLISEDFASKIPALKKIADEIGLAVVVETWNGKDNLPKLINSLLKKADYILALEDPKVFNRNTVKSILLTSYRKNKVVIGPNASYVKAGSLATVWCSTDDVAKAVVDTIEYYKVSGLPPEDDFLRCHSIAINRQVAKSLSIKIPEELEDGLIDSLYLNKEPK